VSFFEQLLQGVVEKSECVALFVIVLILLMVLHQRNSARMDEITRQLYLHDQRTGQPRRPNATPRE